MKFTNKIFAFFAITLMLLSVGCQQQHDMDKITSQVNEMNDLIIKSMMNNDTETVLKLYTEDAISMPSYQPMIKGMEAFKEQSKNQPPMDSLMH